MRNFLTLFLVLCAYINASAQTVDKNKVMDYLQEQQYDEAIRYLRPLIDTNNVRDLNLMAYTWYQAGKMPEAAACYERVLSIDSNAIPALQYLGSIRSQQELYQTALNCYQRVVALRPLNAAAWKQLSYTAYAAGKDDSAFVWLNKSYTLNPMDPRVAARLAEECLDQKGYGRADSIVRAYMAQDSSQAIVLMVAARTAFFNKDYRRTLKLGDKLMAMNVASANTFTYVTLAAYKDQQFNRCLDVYHYLNDRQIASQDISYYTALAYTALTQYDSSNVLLKQCIKQSLTPSLDNYYSAMSANYEALQQYKPAIASLDTAYFLFHEPLREYSIGRIYALHLHNETMGNKYYQRYLQLYPAADATEEEKQVYLYLKELNKMNKPPQNAQNDSVRKSYISGK
jgi:tetratricopeptide (TPR) repeat protein